MVEKTDEKTTEASATAKAAPGSLHSLLGEKIGMTQIYHPKDKQLYDVTIVKAGPCSVIQVKSVDGKDGYNALKLGFGSRRDKNVASAQLGQFKAAKVATAKHVREIRCKDVAGYVPGQTVAANEVFKIGDYVDVQGVSKGKGFAGVMKRHNFRGMPASHGASDKQRSPGSLASRRSLGRVLPGQRMAGRMGGVTESSIKIEVVQIDVEKNLMYLNGSVPGPKGGLVTVSETVKGKKFRTEIVKNLIRKDKMGNIIKAAAPRAAAPKK